ncbi:DUF4114 domain-containing protein [cf. Phormidesmis sp. LEGE 11477]|uniref:DUF4114 domain-containing protein n=1 Tax=cf. Phormidesmis sp. LEGE 11477 TaxID=1828680 RepID=UPI001880C26F|nr:DUF4114 domain-containing protein [cf. Phormidesmis sp. LEGE 11477]MBE9064738.1 DUF4114 domain-containing protein [cf. Phormidesmis sp. LEGE 11477]
MFDTSISGPLPGFSTPDSSIGGLSTNGTTPSNAALQDLTGQPSQSSTLQGLPAQQVIEPLPNKPLTLDELTTGNLGFIEAGSAIQDAQRLTALEENTSNSLSMETAQTSLSNDVLLSGGLLDQASLNSATGTFVVGDRGSVEIDFLFDGGGYSGELAVFTLAGMGGLSASDFTQEAARRALSGSAEGQIVIVDSTEAAQFSGELGERDRNEGTVASTQTLSLATGTRFALMLVPDSTVAAVAAGKTQSDADTPLFSIAAFNPGGNHQLAQVSDGIFAMEDLQIGKGDADFNDIIFQLEGATSDVQSFSQLAAPDKNWLSNPVAQSFLTASNNPPNNPDPDPVPDPNPTPNPDPDPNPNPNPTPNPDPVPDPDPNPDPDPDPVPDPDPTPDPDPDPVPDPDPIPDPDPTPDPDPNPTPDPIVDISGEVNKFTGNTSEADIIATGADSITIGTQTIYIGTEQVSSINQNPIVRSFDPANPDNNWTRRDLETTGTDGRGLGLIWSGTALYGVFSVDGTQGTPAEDFRRASQTVKQNWLRSYGAGGGGKVAVIGQIDPTTGALLKAAYLSAVKQNGQSNSLSITGATVNNVGNLVLSAKSFFSPRRPDGSALTQDPGNTQGSPFDYTVEITPDLTEVISTSADGWS